MEVFRLFSELASETRLGILQALGERPMKFTEISTDFDITSPEVSRQLNRLSTNGLIEKKLDGLYNLTPIGKMTLSCISDLFFISEKSEYFSNHDPLLIPPHLLKNIESLSGGEILTGTFEILDAVDKQFDDISEYFYYVTNDFPRHFIERSEKRIEDGVDFKILLPESLLSNLYPSFSDTIKDNVKFRVQSEVNILVDANDKFSRIALAGTDGSLDHETTIFGSDPKFKTWCKELFDYLWEESKPFEIKTE